MNTESQMRHNTAGFTLIEVIVTLVIAAILATMLVAFMGTNITKSANPIIMVKDHNKLDEVMEKIVNDYKTQIKNGTLNLNSLAASVTGTYSGIDGVIINPSFVLYDNTTGTESSCTSGCKNLKVTITKGDQSVTTLFTQ